LELDALDLIQHGAGFIAVGKALDGNLPWLGGWRLLLAAGMGLPNELFDGRQKLDPVEKSDKGDRVAALGSATAAKKDLFFRVQRKTVFAAAAGARTGKLRPIAAKSYSAPGKYFLDADGPCGVYPRIVFAGHRITSSRTDHKLGGDAAKQTASPAACD
jgi:hypothetical protein